MMGGDASVSAFPDGDNLFHWKGTLAGACGTVRNTESACIARTVEARAGRNSSTRMVREAILEVSCGEVHTREGKKRYTGREEGTAREGDRNRADKRRETEKK